MNPFTIAILAAMWPGMAAQPVEPKADACPQASARAEDRVRMILSSPLLPRVRERFNLGTASLDGIRLLTTEADEAACQALWKAVRESGTVLPDDAEVTFYRSGDTYFVPITRDRPPPGVVRLDGTSSLDIYDAAFRLVGRFSA